MSLALFPSHVIEPTQCTIMAALSKLTDGQLLNHSCLKKQENSTIMLSFVSLPPTCATTYIMKRINIIFSLCKLP